MLREGGHPACPRSSPRLSQRRGFLRYAESGPKRLSVGCMLEAIANERFAIGNGAKQVECTDPAFEKFHDGFLLAPAVSVRRRHDIDMVRKFRADFLAPLLTVKPAHGSLLSARPR